MNERNLRSLYKILEKDVDFFKLNKIMDYSLLVGIEKINDSEKYAEKFSFKKKRPRIASVAGAELTDSIAHLEYDSTFLDKSRPSVVFDKAGYHVHRF